MPIEKARKMIVLKGVMKEDGTLEKSRFTRAFWRPWIARRRMR